VLGLPPPEPGPDLQAFRQGLHALGYVEGQNLVIEYRYAEGSQERLRDLAAELVRLQVEVIVPVNTPAIRAVPQATTTIPIVIVAVIDPVGAGLVASLARPGGNITGISTQVLELHGKWLELLKEAVPHVARVAVLQAPTQGQADVWQEVKRAGQALGVELHALEVRGPDEFESAFDAATREGAGALLILPHTLFNGNESRLAALAVKSRLPALYWRREFAEAGVLMTYGPRRPEVWQRAAAFVAKILQGAKPGDLPVEQPLKFELVINLKTAQVLGITIPPHLLVLADEVIR
jgi:putative ABC transport system substrate-binding protein